MRRKPFDPSALDTHRYVATWFWNQEIHDGVGSYLPYIKDLSCRLYTDCWHEMLMGQDWKKLIRECVAWRNQGGAKGRKDKERIWFSPHCNRP
jgi:hypothetical protein